MSSSVETLKEKPYEYLCHTFVANLPLDDTRKDFRKLWKQINRDYEAKEKEALLALEQKEKLIKHLDNKIRLLNSWKRTDKFAEAKINELEEVRGKIK